MRERLANQTGAAGSSFLCTPTVRRGPWSHSHDSLRGGWGCPHPTGEEQELPRGLETASQGHTPRQEQSALGLATIPQESRGPSALGPPEPLLLQDPAGHHFIGFPNLMLNCPVSLSRCWWGPHWCGKRGPLQRAQVLGPGTQPRVATAGRVHSLVPSLTSGQHLAVPVWSERCPRLGAAGEPALSPREPTPPALGEA